MKVFVNSIPKSGTNLLEKLMRLLGIKRSGRSIALSNIFGRYALAKSMLHQDHFSGLSIPVGLEFPVSVSVKWLDLTLHIPSGHYLSGHAAYSEQLDFLVCKNGLRMLQIYRDPRAVLVSWAKYVAEDVNQWYPLHSFLKAMDIQERILFLLNGGEVNGVYYSSFREVLQRSCGWIDSGNTLVVRFEDLVGSKGGGSDDIQRATIAEILFFLGKEYQTAELDELQKNLFGETHTFRGGQINRWREDIDDELHALIVSKLRGSETVRRLGYEDFF